MSKHYWNVHQKEVLEEEIKQVNQENGYEDETDDDDDDDDLVVRHHRNSEAWVRKFKKNLRGMHPFYLCGSCRKQNFKNNLFKVEPENSKLAKIKYFAVPTICKLYKTHYDTRSISERKENVIDKLYEIRSKLSKW